MNIFRIIITVIVALFGIFISLWLSADVFAVKVSPFEDARTDYNYGVLFVGIFITAVVCIAIWRSLRIK